MKKRIKILLGVMSVLALFTILPLSNVKSLPTELDTMIIVQGNSILSVNEPNYTENRTYASLIPKDNSLELKIIEEIKKYDWNDEHALIIAKCESQLVPTAVNWGDAKITGLPSMGIYQLNRAYDTKYFDYKFNIEEAHKLYERRGWQPWINCGKLL